DWPDVVVHPARLRTRSTPAPTVGVCDLYRPFLPPQPSLSYRTDPTATFQVTGAASKRHRAISPRPVQSGRHPARFAVPDAPAAPPTPPTHPARRPGTSILAVVRRKVYLLRGESDPMHEFVEQYR